MSHLYFLGGTRLTNMNKFKDPAIYALHAGDGNYRYVGSTKTNSKNRLWEHIYRGNNGHEAPVYQWMRSVGVRNVEVVDLEKVDNVATILQAEMKWITRLLDEGFNLTNQMSRDGVLNSMSSESLLKSGAARKGRPTWIKGLHGEAAGWTDGRRQIMRERAEKRRLSRVPNHGTVSEYTKYGCRCEECKAIALHPKVKVETHGRYLYKRDHCRCDICVRANRDYLATYAQRKAA